MRHLGDRMRMPAVGKAPDGGREQSRQPGWRMAGAAASAEHVHHRVEHRGRPTTQCGGRRRRAQIQSILARCANSTCSARASSVTVIADDVAAAEATLKPICPRLRGPV